MKPSVVIIPISRVVVEPVPESMARTIAMVLYRLTSLPELHVRQIADPTGGDVYRAATIIDAAMVTVLAKITPNLQVPVFIMNSEEADAKAG